MSNTNGHHSSWVLLLQLIHRDKTDRIWTAVRACRFLSPASFYSVAYVIGCGLLRHSYSCPPFSAVREPPTQPGRRARRTHPGPATCCLIQRPSAFSPSERPCCSCAATSRSASLCSTMPPVMEPTPGFQLTWAAASAGAEELLPLSTER
jgi:hypothetical protein